MQFIAERPEKEEPYRFVKIDVFYAQHSWWWGFGGEANIRYLRPARPDDTATKVAQEYFKEWGYHFRGQVHDKITQDTE